MNRPFAPLIAILAAILTVAAGAAPLPPDAQPRVAPEGLIRSGPADLAKSGRDTVIVFGGPGTLEGKFETAGGLPDRQGWTGEDLSVVQTQYWHASTFHAADLDPTTPDNHAWWCGTTFDPCSPDDPEEGYGNDWDQWLAWQGTVADPSQAVAVTVTAELAWDTEPGFDFLQLEVETTSGWDVLWSVDGQEPHLSFAQTFTVQSGDLMGPDQDEVHLRWRFISDGAWSDEDCDWPTDFGAAQIDLIAVSFDQGEGPVQVGPVETAEPGSPSAWTPTLPTAVGEFSKVWSGLADLDPCFEDRSPVFAFIDDGEVVPGTGGSPCNTWCYGPGGWVVNHTGGLAGPDELIHDVVWSPPIALPGDEVTGATLSFDVYDHNGFPVFDSAFVFWIWYVKSTADPAGETGWSEPRNENFLYEGGPAWSREAFEVGPRLVPGARWVRIGLGVRQFNFGWFPGDESTPAPYYDNVRLELNEGGPQMTVFGADLAQDAFPAAGAIDPADLGAASVRFDSARDIDPFEAIVPGDSVVVAVKTLGTEASLAEPPRLHYRLFPNPVFDAYRTAGLPPEGSVAGDSVHFQTTYGTIYAFDLPDEGFLFPGDRLHYFFTATQDAGGQFATAILPADTSGFSVAAPYATPGAPVYDSRLVFHALPTLRSADPADRPAMLLWDRSERNATLQAWQYSLAQLGLQDGVDYDLMVSRGFTDQANGLGLLCSAELIAGYDVIACESGVTRSTFAGPTDPWGGPHPAPDTALLGPWLQLGGRALLVAGDRATLNLLDSAPAFLSTFMGADPVSDEPFPEYLGGQINPPVLAAPGAPWTLAMGGWIAAGCVANFRDLRGAVFPVLPYGPDAAALAVYGTPAHDPDVYQYAALLQNDLPDYGSRTVTLVHSLARVQSDPYQGEPDQPLPARARLLGELLASFGMPGTSGPVAAPETPPALTVAAYPNPFNPKVTLDLALPRPGRATVAIYDVRGQRVRKLLDAEQPAGPLRLQWAGTDDAGRAVGAGVYFAQVRARDEERVLKLTLVK